MRKVIIAAALLAAPALSWAQLPPVIEGLQNPIVVVGPAYQTSAPATGSRVQLFLSANVAGVKPFANVPLYLGGVGVDIRTVSADLASVTGAGISIPVVTYQFGGSQFVAQVGWGHDLSGDPTSGKIYAGLGFGLTSHAQLKAKRLAKAKEKKTSETYGVAPEGGK